MTWTYTGDPSLSVRDEVRFEIQDTDSCRQLIQDEELDYVINKQGGDVRSSSIQALEAIIARLSSLGKVVLGRFEYDPITTIKGLQGTLDRFLRSSGEGGGEGGGLPGLPVGNGPWAGGLSYAERTLDATNEDLIPPRFVR